MRIEIREVTVKQEVYIADDGTEFMNEDECTDYEFELLEKSLTLYNSNCDKTDDVESCYFVNLITDVDVKSFIRACNVYGLQADGINEPGLYMYGCDDMWVNIDKVISIIKGEKR